MSSVNKMILLGRLGDDVKMHYFEGGNCIGRVSLATSENYINKQTNERVTATEWHNCVLRNKDAENVAKYAKKGSLIYFEGKMKTRSYTAESGETRYVTEMHVYNFQFISSVNDQQAAPATQQQAAPQSNQTQGYTGSGHAGDDFLAGRIDRPAENAPHDDLPF